MQEGRSRPTDVFVTPSPSHQPGAVKQVTRVQPSPTNTALAMTLILQTTVWGQTVMTRRKHKTLWKVWWGLDTRFRPADWRLGTPMVRMARRSEASVQLPVASPTRQRRAHHAEEVIANAVGQVTAKSRDTRSQLDQDNARMYAFSPWDPIHVVSLRLRIHPGLVLRSHTFPARSKSEILHSLSSREPTTAPPEQCTDSAYNST